jgi:hypothetical protein
VHDFLQQFQWLGTNLSQVTELLEKTMY